MTVKGGDEINLFVQQFVEHIFGGVFILFFKKGIFLVFVNIFLKRFQGKGGSNPIPLVLYLKKGLLLCFA